MIVAIVVERKEPFAAGHEFSAAGAYEKLVGRVYGEVDPASPLNQVIVNLDKAPLSRTGKVAYCAEFYLLKPLDMARGSGKIFYDVVNRGNKRILAFMNDAPENNDPSDLEAAGNGFLMRQGYAIVWSGWQGDLIAGGHRLAIQVPVATERGREIVAAVRTEIVVTKEGVFSYPLSGDRRVMSYESATNDKSKASLTIREKSYGPRIPVPDQEWEFAVAERDVATGKSESRPSTRDLYLRSGFKPGHIYEFTYPAKNPLVLGLGFAAVRDLISFLRYEPHDLEGRSNPLASRADKLEISTAYAWGRSQSGRFLRDFVYQGFNEDESGRKVFDAVAPHAAGGGRLFLNYEFARPITSAQQHTNQLEPEIFPFAYNAVRDPQTGKEDGILKRPSTDPYVVHTQTATEYWQKRGSLVHTDGKGCDLRIPGKVRIYAFASAPHNAPFGSRPRIAGTQQPTNPLNVSAVLRALMVAMDRWVCDGVTPPPSHFPSVQDGNLVPPDRSSTGFPDIPGVRYTGIYNRQLFLDYGPNISRGKIERHPPRELGQGRYVILVPKADQDGNDLAGIRMPLIQVPLATYTGWNLQDKKWAEDELCGLLGSYIPFPRTQAEREERGDPRLSIEERYRDRGDFVLKVRAAVNSMLENGLLLSEGAEAVVREAEEEFVEIFSDRSLDGKTSESRPAYSPKILRNSRA